MRFKLEKESVQGNTCNNKHVANVKVDSETTFSLPTTFYAFAHDKRSPLLYSFIIYETHHDITKSLNVFVDQEIQLELEKVGNDYKLALVDSLGNPYYHYYYETRYQTYSNDIIYSIVSIPEDKIRGKYVQIYDYEKCGVGLKLLSDSRVLIDPKDIISSKDISPILTNTKLIIKAEGIFQIKDSFISYLSANVYDFTGEKVGTLNNVGCHFDRGGNLFHLSPYEHLNHSYFATKKLGNNYVGCISNEKGECREFYGLNPSSFGYEHDSSPYPYPYYYNLENFNVDLVNLKEFEDLKAEVKKLKRASICSPSGPKGEPGVDGQEGNIGLQGVAGVPGPKGDQGIQGLKGDKGNIGLPGPVGSQGEKGDVGPQGLKGIQGLKGDISEKGDIGAPGTDGLKGDIGPRGPQGNKGNQGLVGPVGSKGDRGPKGEKGDIGTPGLKGNTGNQGVAGAPGTNGLKGAVGKDGLPGLQGHKGDIGSQGLQGEKGNQGVAGPKGERGNNGTDANPEEVAQKLINNGTIVNQVLEYRDQDGDLVLEQQIAGKLIYDKNIHAGIATELIDNKAQELTDALLSDANDTLVAKLANSTELTQSISEGLRQNPGETKGAQGVAGLPGIPGPKGESGIQGFPGAKGEPGIDGLPGPIGPKGADGLPGIKGEPGLRGFNGTQGLSGSKGEPGIDGLKGDTGPIGTQGNKGEPGIDGTKGNQGNIGPKGIDGVPGLMGIKGDMGEKGDTGAPGIDGLQGHKGDIGSQGLQGEKGNQGVAGLPGIKGDQGVRGLKGIDGASGSKGEKGNTGPVGSKGADGLPGMPGPVGLKGDKGDIGLQGPKGQAGRSGSKGSIGETGSIGMPGLKGEDGIGADVASQFLRTINQTKLEIQDAQKTAEIAKTASEKSAKEALYAEDKVTKLHDKIANLTKRAETFKNQAVQSQRSTEALRQDTREFHSKTKDIFCKTKPTDQVCTVRRKKRETPPVTSGASRPIPFISQVINFFYPSVGQDEYKLKNKIQELDQVAKVIDAADIVTKFEKVLEKTASKCSIPKKSLNFDLVKLQSTIINKSLFNDGNRNELLKFLCVAAKKSFSHYKQIDKCLATFKDHMEKTLKTNEQQRDFVNTEKIVADSEQPRSFMSDVTPLSTFNAINQEVFGYLR